MDLNQFISDYRLFRQKLCEELAITDEELILKFFIAYKNLQRIHNKSNDVLKSVMDFFNTSTFAYPPYSNDPDSEGNDDDPYSGGIPFWVMFL